MSKTFFYISIFIAFLAFACEQEEFNTSSSAKLNFSTDTVLFDTVFSTIGSTTKYFTVRNPYNESVKISSIRLAGGNDSPYRLNIDGFSGNYLENVEILEKDSIYIYVEVTVDPLNQDAPLVVEDSIIFTLNQNIQSVKLVSWGQDVYIIKNEIVYSDRWTAGKPYLIYDTALIGRNEILEVEAGTRIFFHKKAKMIVAGSLVVNGTADDPVIFASDRLEDEYDDIPGQWDGIWMVSGSKDNVINYAEIKNATIGIQVDTFAVQNEPTLVLSNSKIENMSSVGLMAQGSIVEAYNTLIANCGYFTVMLNIGGSYNFNHCTFANYYKWDVRSTPSVYMSNYYIDYNNQVQKRPLDKAYFGNCIIYGRKEDEILFDQVDDPTVPFNYFLDHTIIRYESPIDINDTEHFENVFLNVDPKFADSFTYDFQLDTLSPAKDVGKESIGLNFPIDLLGNNRISDKGPDIGAYERME